LQFSNILKTLLVAVQTARAKCVIIARDRLTLDTAPLVSFINGLIPVPSPVRLTLPFVHVRYDALTPPPLECMRKKVFALSICAFKFTVSENQNVYAQISCGFIHADINEGSPVKSCQSLSSQD
jgi:hypothetical protein